MNNIGFIIDNTSVLFEDDYEQFNVAASFALKALTDDEKDSVDFDSITDYYSYLISNKQFGKTSTASLGDIQTAIDKGFEKFDKLIVVTTAGHISSTYNNAVIASKNYDQDKIAVIDSTSVVGATKFIVQKGNELLKVNDDFNDIVEQLRSFAKKTRTLIIISSFDALIANGRIGKAKGSVANLLNIKAIVSVDLEGVNVVSKFRSYNKAIKSLVELVSEKYDADFGIYSGHIFNNEVFTKIKTSFQNLNISINEIVIPPIIGIHGGDGLFGITYCEK